jgi:hypothetical protein
MQAFILHPPYTMSNLSTLGAWSFYPLASPFPSTILPNIAYWNVTNGTWEYEVQVSWPLNWTSRDVTSTVETLYIHVPPPPISKTTSLNGIGTGTF